MTDVVCYGAGGLARTICQIIADINADGGHLNFVGFLDDDAAKIGSSVSGYEVLGGLDWALRHPTVSVVLGIGSSSGRYRLAQRLSVGERVWATLVHPEAWVCDRGLVGPGAILYPGVLVDVGVSLGRHVLINKNVTVGHDSVLRDFCTLAPGVNIGGHVQVGEGTEFGINSAVIQNIQIGDWSVIGAGTVVIRDVEPNAVAVGAPARVIRQLPEGWHDR